MDIGFVSTRFAGLDGVSLEAEKWAAVFASMGHRCHWFAGELDKPVHRSYRAAEAHFQHPVNRWINERVFGRPTRSRIATKRIHSVRRRLKAHLLAFVQHHRIDLMVVENASAIPMHIPLGLAIAEAIEESGVPAIGHHHDFAWERSRFVRNGVRDMILSAFPPALPQMAHVVINGQAKEALVRRKNLSASVVPNVFDFEHPPEPDPRRAGAFRKAVGAGDGDTLLLQPTRVVARKGIEHAVDLAARLGSENCTLAVSHPAGDEGFDYQSRLKQQAGRRGVRLVFADRLIGASEIGAVPVRGFSLWDAYAASDFVTYPSLCEGFGNALLEAVYFRKPVLINRYGTYLTDIRPAGFDLVEIDGKITDAAVEKVRALLSDPDLRKQAADHNFRCGRLHFSYKVLRDRLASLLDHGLAAPAKRPKTATAG